MKVSLIISVYRNVADLKIVLDGLHFQSFKDFEIIVSEDGEFEGMRDFLLSYTHINPIVHLTQPDTGWKKNAALNNAIRKSSSEYLIFIDGDCVLHEKFIENHIRFSKVNGVVAGKRVKLGPIYSNIFRENIDSLPALQLRIEREGRKVRADGAKFYEEGFYFNPSGPLAFIPRLRKMSNLKGCNMSFHRATIEAINGFDEDFELPAIGEDIDLTWRFKGLGYKLISVRNIAVQYHLFHKENWTDQSINQAKMESKMTDEKFVCVNGLVKKGHV